MIAVFLPLIVLAFATVQFEGLWAVFPFTFFIFWIGVSLWIIFIWLPLKTYNISVTEENFLQSWQNKFQWFSILWIIALQVFSAPSRLWFSQLHNVFPQVLPMFFSLIGYCALMWGASEAFHWHQSRVFLFDQTREEFFRARLTLPILFFPPIFIWMIIEDLISQYATFSIWGEIWILILAPVFFIVLYLFSPYLFNLAWRAVPLNNSVLCRRIVLLAERSKTPIAGIKIWDTFKEPLANAAVAGLAGKYRFVYLTRYLLDVFSEDEIEAIVAHEVGHFRLGHVWTYLLFTIDLIFVSIAIKLYTYFWFPKMAKWYVDYASIVDPVIFLGGFLIIFTALTRLSERQADKFAATLVGSEAFVQTMENLQEQIGVPVRKLPWWAETHPDFYERIAEIRNWHGKQEALIWQATKIRILLIAIGLIAIMFVWPNAKIAWQLSVVLNQIEREEFPNANFVLNNLAVKLGDHPKILELKGIIAFKTGKWWDVAMIATELAFGKTPSCMLKKLEILHHTVSPKIAFNLQIVQFLLQTLDLGGIHRVPLFNQCFNFIQAVFS